MDLAQLFTPIEFENGQVLEFPLDIILSGPKDNLAHVVYAGRIIRSKPSDDYIAVPTILAAEEISDVACKLVIAAGKDRNIIVYDAAAKQGKLTGRLIALLRILFRHNIPTNSLFNPIPTDIFIDESEQIDEKLFSIITNTFHMDINKIDMSGPIEYYKRIGGSFPTDKSKLAILVKRSNPEDYFVMPVQKNNKYGLAILNSKVVLLGAY